MNAIEKYESACKALDSNLISLDEFEKEIAPLRDVEPVIHARWFYLNGRPECGACGMWIQKAVMSGVFNYCPNCGAKMDIK